MPQKDSAEKAVRDIRRKTRQKFSAEEKIRIVIEGRWISLRALGIPPGWPNSSFRGVSDSVGSPFDFLGSLAREDF